MIVAGSCGASEVGALPLRALERRFVTQDDAYYAKNPRMLPGALERGLSARMQDLTCPVSSDQAQLENSAL
jgi:hypothetical protein